MKDQPTTIITGSYSGIGEVLTNQLAAAGHALILLNRQEEKTLSHVKKLKATYPDTKVDFALADFGDLEQVKRAAIKIAAKHKSISFAYLNAGWIGTKYQSSVQGHDMNFQVNVLANYAILQLLRPSLARGAAQVVASGSGARQMVRKTSLELVQNQARKTGMAPYAQSKQALVDLFLVLSDEMSHEQISLNVVDLPPTKTEMARNKAVPGIMRLFSFLFATPEKAVAKLSAAANSAPIGSQQSEETTEEQSQLIKLVRSLTEL